MKLSSASKTYTKIVAQHRERVPTPRVSCHALDWGLGVRRARVRGGCHEAANPQPRVCVRAAGVPGLMLGSNQDRDWIGRGNPTRAASEGVRWVVGVWVVTEEATGAREASVACLVREEAEGCQAMAEGAEGGSNPTNITRSGR